MGKHSVCDEVVTGTGIPRSRSGGEVPRSLRLCHPDSPRGGEAGRQWGGGAVSPQRPLLWLLVKPRAEMLFLGLEGVFVLWGVCVMGCFCVLHFFTSFLHFTEWFFFSYWECVFSSFIWDLCMLSIETEYKFIVEYFIVQCFISVLWKILGT